MLVSGRVTGDWMVEGGFPECSKTPLDPQKPMDKNGTFEPSKYGL